MCSSESERNNEILCVRGDESHRHGSTRSSVYLSCAVKSILETPNASIILLAKIFTEPIQHTADDVSEPNAHRVRVLVLDDDHMRVVVGGSTHTLR